jgi:hypothetical protein
VIAFSPDGQLYKYGGIASNIEQTLDLLRLAQPIEVNNEATEL